MGLCHTHATSHTPRLIPVTLSLGYHMDPCQAPILYALSEGLFTQQGLSVTLIPASGGEESSRQVAMQHAHIGITKSANHIVRTQHKNMPLVIIGTLVNTPLEVLIVRGDHKTLPSLKGKTIGYSTSNATFTHKIIDLYLSKMGLARKDVTLRAYQQGMTQAFLRGEVDALFTATHPHDTALIQRFGASFSTFSYRDFGAPDFAQFILFTHKNSEHAEFIAPFLRALTDAISTLKADPLACWNRVIRTFPALNTPLHQNIWLMMIDRFVNDPRFIDTDALTTLIQFMKPTP